MRYLLLAIWLVCSSAFGQMPVPANQLRVISGGGGGCGNITPSVVAARTSGTAPLYVHLNATGTTDSGVTSAYLDPTYSWSFGDPASGATWGQGSNPGVNSKNAATGPITGHVFETPGTYTVTLTVYDGTDTCVDSTTSITVADPNTTFSSTTVCIGNILPVAGVGGCPLGSAVAFGTDADAICATQLAAGKRRLIWNRGDTFTITGGNCDVTVTGPGLIGAYGTGAKPIFNASGETNPGAFNFGGQNFPNSTSNLKDWRIMDLDIRGNDDSELISAQGGFNQLTYLRIDGSACDDACIMFNGDLLAFYNTSGHATHTVWTEIAIVDSSFGHPSSWSLYAYLNKFFVAGNLIDNQSVGSHVFRMPYAANGSISNDTVQNNGLGSAGTHVLKIHGPSFAGDGLFAAGTYSENNVVSDNKFTAGNFSTNQWTVALDPQDSSEDERLRNFIVERNLFVAGTNTVFGASLQVVSMSVRNNLFIGTGAAQATSISLDRRSSGAPAPSSVSLLNNSMFTNSANLNNTDEPFIDIDASVSSGTIIKNNLGYAPNASGSLMIRCSSTCTSGNNTSTVATNPNFSTSPPTSTITTWKPTSGYAVGGGASVLNWYDILGVAWKPTWDIGAVKH